MKSAARMLVSIAVAAFVLAGCGNRGPLYLPDKPTQKSAPNQPQKSDKKKEKADGTPA